MQYALRPYATAGVAVVGASIIAVTPLPVPLPEIQARSVRLVDAWSELVTDTTANLQNITDHADPTAISGVFNAFLSNPYDVIQALTSLDPTVDTTVGTLPATVNIELPPGLELALAQLGAEGVTLNAINDISGQLASNPSAAFSTLLEAPATIANAYLNGADNISLLNGSIDIAGFNGILAPLTDVSVSLNLPNLLDALGLGDVNLNLGNLLGGLPNIDNLGELITALNLDSTSLLGLLPSSLGSLLDAFNLDGLALPGIDLTSVLSAFGLDDDVALDNLPLDTVLNAFGIPTDVGGNVQELLTAVGLGGLLDESVGSLLPSNLLQSVVDSLIGSLSPALVAALTALGVDPTTILDPTDLVTALSNISIGDLIGAQTFDTGVAQLLEGLGITAPADGLTIGGILDGLGYPDSITGLTLGGLLDDLGLGGLSITDPLGGLDLGSLLGGLGLSDLPIDLSNLSDLGSVSLDSLLGALGLADIATINIDGFGGLDTLLVDVIPQQILASLGM